MARHYANVHVSIWRDIEFCALTPGAQRTYFMLITQPDIAACGSLPLTIRRWSSTIHPDSRSGLRGWLEELATARFIVIDEETEELLVRSFAKWDGGYRNDKRVKAIEGTAEAIRSATLRSWLAVELAKLDIEDCPSNALPLVIDSPSIGDGSAIDNPRVVVTLRTDSHNPQPQPESTTREPAPPKTVARTRGSRLPPNWRPSEAVVAWARAAGHDDAWMRKTTEDFCDYWHAKAGSGAVKLDWDLTWRRWVKKAADDRRGGAGKKSTTDQRVSDGLALAAKYQAEGR